MSDVDVVERVRMAVAEAGYDPDQIDGGPSPRGGFLTFGTLPISVAWKAGELAGLGPQCLACCEWSVAAQREHRRYVHPPCLADRRFTEDCGVERSS